MAEALANLKDITGLDEASCVSLLEIAHGDVETALAIFFERGSETAQDESSTAPTGLDALLFEVKDIPPSWGEQDFVSIKRTMNVLQKKNGPCGVMAGLLAQIAVMRFESSTQANMDVEITRKEAKEAFYRVLLRCKTKNEIRFKGRVLASHLDLTDEEVSAQGCLVDLVRGIIETKGVDVIRKEVDKSQGELPLIIGPHFLCSSELMSLMIRGKADGDFSAISATTGTITDDSEWSSQGGGFGILTRPSEQAPPANALKFPRFVSFVNDEQLRITDIQIIADMATPWGRPLYPSDPNGRKQPQVPAPQWFATRWSHQHDSLD